MFLMVDLNDDSADRRQTGGPDANPAIRQRNPDFRVRVLVSDDVEAMTAGKLPSTSD